MALIEMEVILEVSAMFVSTFSKSLSSSGRSEFGSFVGFSFLEYINYNREELKGFLYMQLSECCRFVCCIGIIPRTELT